MSVSEETIYFREGSFLTLDFQVTGTRQVLVTLTIVICVPSLTCLPPLLLQQGRGEFQLFFSYFSEQKIIRLVHTGGSSPAIIVGQFCKIDRAILQNCTTENPEEFRPSCISNKRYLLSILGRLDKFF